MKKSMSFIALIAILITIGTAYAAWHFAEAAAEENLGIGLTDYVTDGTVTIDSVTQGTDTTNILGSNVVLHETGSIFNTLTIIITHTADATNPATVGFVGTYEIELSTDLEAYIAISNANGVINEDATTTITATITWISGEPTTVSEYQALETILAQPGHTITIKAEVSYTG